MKNPTKPASHVGEVIGIAAGAVALSVAGYLLFGPNAKKNRKVIKSWTIKAKGELLEKIENMKEVTEDEYGKAVSNVMKKYEQLKTIAPEEITKLTEELNKHWKSIKRDHTPVKKPSKKIPKK